MTLTCQSIANLQDLYGFFSTLGAIWPPHNFDTAERDVDACLTEIETVLSADFLEKMPAARWKILFDTTTTNSTSSAISAAAAALKQTPYYV